MSRSPFSRRTAVLAALAPIITAAFIATAAPAGAVLTEGEPDSASCLRIRTIPGAGAAGSTLFVSHGYAAVLVPRAEC
ncbi:hypothetical protein E4P40_05865 [Blastococcus sp. CT_GayMR20]|uniref:hypothetical protein n=1 Tax=Blastococcus sp. CT_GayMR20 TaxID=2559609 RepID=UPI0010745948|nr:hypothetical protein [Blastococcus sp. CT_GayMR20]TFV91553.1 hypothetical protein E4P40_05865 [Blastococcus sp. CT_GayMR20]